MELVQKSQFAKTVKKLHSAQKKELDAAIRKICNDPFIGEAKVGDLAGIRVFKFRMQNQLMLLAYEYWETPEKIVLLALGAHENFYRDLKR